MVHMTTSPQFHVPADYPSLTAAVAAATPVYGTVVLAPGLYRVTSTVRVGAGMRLMGSSAEDTIIESSAQTTVACADGALGVSDVCIQQVDSGVLEPVFGLELRGGTTVERCRIRAACRARNAAGVLARTATAMPTLNQCIVDGCGYAGMILAAGASASLSGCTLRGCGGGGVLVLQGCSLKALTSTIAGCAESAMTVGGKATADLRECTLSDNGGTGGVPTASFKAGSRGILRGCRVLDGRGVGIQLAEESDCEVEGCTVLRSAKAGVAAKAPRRLVVARSEVGEGGAAGVMLLHGGRGTTLSDNTIRGNAKSAIQLSGSADPLVEGNQILDGMGPGIFAFDGARGSFVRNLIRGGVVRGRPPHTPQTPRFCRQCYSPSSRLALGLIGRPMPPSLRHPCHAAMPPCHPHRAAPIVPPLSCRLDVLLPAS